MENLIHKEEYRGFTVKWYYDDLCDNPRTWDNVAIFVCEHPRYCLGDRQDIENCIDELYERHISEEIDDVSFAEKLDALSKCDDIVMHQISMYEHSGVSIWLGGTFGHPYAQWGCSRIGFAYVEKETAEKEYGLRNFPNEKFKSWQDWAEYMMKAEMSDYNSYVSGKRFCFQVEDADENTIDACGGYLGYECFDSERNEIHAIIDLHIKEEAERKANELKNVCDNLSKIAGQTFVYSNNVIKIAKDMFGNDCIERAAINKCRVGEFSPVSIAELSDDTISMLSHKIA